MAFGRVIVLWLCSGSSWSHEFRASSRDALLGGIAAQIKLDDGSHLYAVDDSDFTDFICHHAWFEGDEVPLSREDRVCLLEFSQDRHSGSAERYNQGLVACCRTWQAPFLETESHELEPEENGTTELELEEVTIHDENGDDDIASTGKPLTANQKSVIQNIHNNCGHPSREEFLRALRLSRARPEVLSYVRREFECPACATKGHPPKPRMPAALPRTLGFNETLGVYLFEIESPDGTKIIFCNMVLGHVVSTVHSHSGQDHSYVSKVHNRTVDSIF